MHVVFLLAFVKRKIDMYEMNLHINILKVVEGAGLFILYRRMFHVFS